MPILKIKDENGNWTNVPALKGDTPIKGVDYWNEEDKEEIETYCKNYIDEQITQAIGGAY